MYLKNRWEIFLFTLEWQVTLKHEGIMNAVKKYLKFLISHPGKLFNIKLFLRLVMPGAVYKFLKKIHRRLAAAQAESP